jgi:hypothetical protein
MNAPLQLSLPKFVLQTLNHLYEVERKLALHGDAAGVLRNIERIKDAFADEKLFYEDPMGQAFSETRADLEASIAGEGTENLRVTEVIKPIVRYGDAAYSRVVQKGIVVVRSQTAEAEGNQKGKQQ